MVGVSLFAGQLGPLFAVGQSPTGLYPWQRHSGLVVALCHTTNCDTRIGSIDGVRVGGRNDAGNPMGRPNVRTSLDAHCCHQQRLAFDSGHVGSLQSTAAPR